MYAAMTWISLLAFYAYFKALNTNKLVPWMNFALASLLAFNFSYFYGLWLLASSAPFFFKKYRPFLKKWLFSVVFVFSVQIFLYPVFLSQYGFVKHSFWIPIPTPETLFWTFRVFNLGYTSSYPQYHLALFLFSCLFVFGACRLYKKDHILTVTILSFIFFPILSAFVISKLVAPVYINRQLLIFSPLYYLFIAYGIDRLARKELRVFVFLFVILLISTSLYNYYGGYMFYHPFRANLLGGVFPKKRYLHLFDSLMKEFRPHDILVAGDLQSYILLRSYLLKNDKTCPVSVDQLRFLFYPEDLFRFSQRYLKINNLIEQMPEKELSELHEFQLFENDTRRLRKSDLEKESFRRIWLVLASWEPERQLSAEAGVLHVKLAEQYRYVSWQQNDGIFVELFLQDRRGGAGEPIP